MMVRDLLQKLIREEIDYVRNRERNNGEAQAKNSNCNKYEKDAEVLLAVGMV